LRSATLGKNLELGTLRFLTGLPARPVRQRGTAKPFAEGQSRINFDSFQIPLGAATPSSGSGWISSQGYNLQVQGDAELGRLLQVARATGIAGPRFGLFGTARLDVALSGEWAGFAKVRTFGRAQIRSARAEVPGIASPVHIQSAQIELADDQVLFHNLTAQIGKSVFSGEAQFPRSCNDVVQVFWLGRRGQCLGTDARLRPDCGEAFAVRPAHRDQGECRVYAGLWTFGVD
jgi:hypothetical protein